MKKSKEPPHSCLEFPKLLEKPVVQDSTSKKTKKKKKKMDGVLNQSISKNTKNLDALELKH